jgi:RNA polymerase sigma factor (sigma-70 family)
VEATSAPRTHAFRLAKPRRILAALSDEKLVEHVRRGDSVAFEVLYDRHSPGVLAFCRHMLRSAHDAEDAVQHSFIAAHADLQRRADREIHFKAWLYTIARNRCLSMLRARHDQPHDQVDVVTDRLNEDIQQRADLRALLADIHQLPDDQREALVLSEVGALSHTEVAEVIGCEVAKVKSLVFQARTALLDRRVARDTPCEEIREQIATLRGGALRRSHLRHHLEACPGCSEYREQIRRQRQMLAIALPVVPSAALRGHVMAALGIGGSTAAAGGAGVGGLTLAAKSGVAKLGIAALVAGGAAGSAAVVHHGGVPGFMGTSSSAGQPRGDAANMQGGAGAAGASGPNAPAAAQGAAGTAGGKSGHAGTRSESGTKHGFTPVQGESNGARAREFAATRGNGRHTGLTKTHHTPTRTRRHGAHKKPVHVKKTPPGQLRSKPETRTPRANPVPKVQPAPKTQAAPKSSPAPTTEPPATTEPAPAETTPTEPAAPSPTTPVAPDATTGGGRVGGKALGKSNTG